MKRIFGVSREDLKPNVDPWDVLEALEHVRLGHKGVRADAIAEAIVHVMGVLQKPISLEETPEA